MLGVLAVFESHCPETGRLLAVLVESPKPPHLAAYQSGFCRLVMTLVDEAVKLRVWLVVAIPLIFTGTLLVSMPGNWLVVPVHGHWPGKFVPGVSSA